MKRTQFLGLGVAQNSNRGRRPGQKMRPHCGRKIGPAYTLYKADGAPKAAAKKCQFPTDIQNLAPGFCARGDRRLALEQLLARADASWPEAITNQHGRVSNPLVSDAQA